MSDPRFARLHSDPRFVRPKANKHKVVVDDRFKQLFDESAGSSGKGKLARKVDKYGRPLAKEASVNELKRYYRLASPEAEALKKGAEAEEEGAGEEDEDEDEEEEEVPSGKGFVDLARGEVLLESSDEEDDDDDEALASDAESTSSSAAGAVTLGSRSARRRVSRSPSIDLSETEHPTFPDTEDEEEEAVEADDEPGAEPTRRVAIVNMDWDHLRASDLYRVLSSCLSATASSVIEPRKPKPKYDADGNELESYKPSAKLTIAPGRLLSLRIYPSMFGRERLEREAIEGPPTEVLKAKGAESDDEDEDGKTLKLGAKKGKGKSKRRRGEDSDDEFGEQDLIDEQLQDGEEDYDTEALRKYQLERLRYYFAIATFSSVAAAAHAVEQINGSEFERTANIFDLQYVPDETSFDDDPVHDEATEASIAAEGNSYQGLEFSTDALRHSKVKLTWDADDPHRKTKMQTYLAAALDRSKQKGATKGRPQIKEADIDQYLASSSDEEEGGAAAEEDEEEQDDFFEAPAEDAKPRKGKKESKRDRMRALLGLGGDDADEDGAEVSWDGGKKSSKGGDAGMQITFAPALSERSAKQLDLAGEERMETSLERYKRKEKERKERKKAERKARAEGRLSGSEDEDAAAPVQNGGDDLGFDDDFFADDGEDPFAAYDGGAGLDSGDEIGGPSKKQQQKQAKKDKRAQREAQAEADAKEQAELALLVGSDDEDVLGADGEGGRHFDMRQILKAEKNKGKKAPKARGKGKKGAAKEVEAVKDEFKIDVQDDRFKSLHEDFDYAIDPSNPRYQKSRNMEALLAEGRKRRSTKSSSARAPVAARDPSDANANRKRSAAEAASGFETGESLSKLVDAVKRKAGDVGGRGKRAKV